MTTKKMFPFPNTVAEKQWVADFAVESKRNKISYDAADIVKSMFDAGLTPEEAVARIRYHIKKFKYTWLRFDSKSMQTEEQLDGVPDWQLYKHGEGSIEAKLRTAAKPFWFDSFADAIAYADDPRYVTPKVN